MSSLLLGVRMTSFDFQRIKMENVNFDSRIKEFKNEVSQKANIARESLELVYCGNILDDESTLRSSGIKAGVMIHVLKKKEKVPSLPATQMSEADILSLVRAFRTLTFNPSYKSSLQKLGKPEALENIIAITPGLNQDPVAISIIQDPELLVRLGDAEIVKRLVELHPSLVEAANHIVAAAHEEAVSSTAASPGQASTSTGIPQFLNFASDDDDMESSQSSDSIAQGVSRQASFSAITRAQLAAALASASQNPPSGTAGSGNAGASDAGNAITPEMVSEAMQRAMASVSPGAPSGLEQMDTDPVAAIRGAAGFGQPDYADQMRQMRELGLSDDAVNLQALQLAAGNVHAAVDLVFSGAISSPNPGSQNN
ncbi:Ubiquitin-like 7 (Bone marrow stromal cell-derived) [Nesidiocoris tenuis]|uniref:Ubiquitin-like 7 (Bone marrow stromal cell-derived) n=1 Tax=Nesidiocoris tenuis TaxID=355587 RepID=A0ABN7ADD8_9HEMI|nr:Ubiquitin-like 7 (Bone marrow stromal cell-derived) [Nesidiocoris tenuis]